jgi:hypothetical protein
MNYRGNLWIIAFFPKGYRFAHLIWSRSISSYVIPKQIYIHNFNNHILINKNCRILGKKQHLNRLSWTWVEAELEAASRKLTCGSA